MSCYSDDDDINYSYFALHLKEYSIILNIKDIYSITPNSF